jgi:hypothetical protein
MQFTNCFGDSSCANDAEFTAPQIPYQPFCHEINRLSALNSNPDSFSERNTSDFTLVSNINSTEKSAPLDYANLETVLIQHQIIIVHIFYGPQILMKNVGPFINDNKGRFTFKFLFYMHNLGYA